ncbi:MAG TPA: acetyl-CoA carboxylase biotin carboxylase subunit [Acidobacteriota bacterium]|nr:acetyl-CoA carboxylase biotin carboxylase subunit [Acidobacteriota bacterium]
MKEIRRILVANRGEIAVRIIRACRDLGIEAVAVYSDADREALHVRLANRAYRLGPAAASESYLRIDRLTAIALQADVDAVHPGYGFLAENPDFARAVGDAGLTFIGPRPEVMAAVGDKNRARQIARDVGAPTVPGSSGPLESAADAGAVAEQLGYPVMLKAVAGGGGKGMRRVTGPDEMDAAFRAATSEATSSFGDGRVYVERVIVRPRHIEIQVLCDEHGNRIHLGERECSLQRRHQKVVEEAPSPALDDGLRGRMGEAALAIADKAGYTNAGTVEFLLDPDGNFYFIEVNARLQVEHAVTEMVTGIDLVAAQIAIARGALLPWEQSDVRARGHAIECRIYAEDPENGFAPAPGVIESLRLPGGPGVRDDSALYEGYEVPIFYDPMISKLITWGSDRPAAVRRMRRALQEYKVVGISTTIPLFQRIMQERSFNEGIFDTGYLDELLGDSSPLSPRHRRYAELVDIASLSAALHAFRREEARVFQVLNGRSSAWKMAGRERGLRRVRR